MDNIAEECEVRRGPWTVEEDIILINYIANHGEASGIRLLDLPVSRDLRKLSFVSLGIIHLGSVWFEGLKRTGKSCRLRWLNYLCPDLRRRNITTEEQLLIIELHAKWGNRWSKIAKHLPGRTDNEIKLVENGTNREIPSKIEGLNVHDQALLSSFGYEEPQSHGIQAYSNGGVHVASSSR